MFSSTSGKTGFTFKAKCHRVSRWRGVNIGCNQNFFSLPLRASARLRHRCPLGFVLLSETVVAYFARPRSIFPHRHHPPHPATVKRKQNNHGGNGLDFKAARFKADAGIRPLEIGDFWGGCAARCVQQGNKFKVGSCGSSLCSLNPPGTVPGQQNKKTLLHFVNHVIHQKKIK